MNLQQEKKLTFKRLIQSVSRFYNVKAKDITGKRRKKDFVKARQIIAYLAREKLKKSFPVIGHILGGRDHTTAIYSYHKIKDKIERNESFKKEVENILLENYVAEETKDDIAEIKLPKLEIEFEKPKFIIKSSEDIPLQELSSEHSIRQSDILKKYKEGQTLEKIGKEYNLTRERIRQIVENGLIQSIGVIIKEGITIDLKEFLKEEKHKHLQVAIEKQNIYRKESFLPKKERRWSKYYDRCRKCGTTIIHHCSHGYCRKCYPKTKIFKEMQESSRLRNIDKWKSYAKKYSKEYSRRPEVIAKMNKRWDLKYFGGNRERTILRDKERCQFCGLSREESYAKHNKDLIVVHINNLLDHSLENLLTLCKNCFYDHMRDRKQIHKKLRK